jgi:hypothetical protein
MELLRGLILAFEGLEIGEILHQSLEFTHGGEQLSSRGNKNAFDRVRRVDRIFD